MSRPQKPHPDFPLTPRADGRWTKRINGRHYYFTGTAKEALKQYHEAVSGRAGARGRQVGNLVNELLTEKMKQVEAGELSPRTFSTWKRGCDAIIEHFGRIRDVDSIEPGEFAGLRTELAKGRGLVALRNHVNTVRGVFTWGYQAGILTKPAQFGTGFDPPRKRNLRAERAELDRRDGGVRMVTPEEFRALVEAASDPFRAIVLLGLNAAYGSTDVATLPLADVDLAGGWATYPRPKTGEKRRAWLWPETVEALRVAVESRRPPKDPDLADRLFLTRNRGPWAFSRITAKGSSNHDQVSRRFRLLTDRLGLRRPGLVHYSLRRTFRTVADEVGDDPAVNLVMGHASPGMGAIYRQRIGDDRVRAVCEHVRNWAGVSPEGNIVPEST